MGTSSTEDLQERTLKIMFNSQVFKIPSLSLLIGQNKKHMNETLGWVKFLS